jgi:hypothetical protein
MVAVPPASAVGVNEMEPAEFGLEYVTIGFGIKPGLLDVVVTASV